MGTESTPLVVSAGENLLIIETHGVFGGRRVKRSAFDFVSSGGGLVLSTSTRMWTWEVGGRRWEVGAWCGVQMGLRPRYTL